MNIYRQGDVLIVQTRDKRPSGVMRPPRNGRIILVEGEATGHHHAVPEICEVLEMEDGRMWMLAPDEIELTHQEHNTINIAPGTYWIVRQREYAPEEIRYVQD